MKIIVNTINGRYIDLEVLPTSKVIDLKAQIFTLDDLLLPDSQTLIFRGRKLNDSKFLYEYGICENSQIQLLINVKAC